MEINVTKLTDENLLRKANSFTTGHDSTMSLETAYRIGHSPIRTQLFWVECRDIPLCVASHLVRHPIGVTWYQRSKRPDRGGEDFQEVCENLSKAAKGVLDIPYGRRKQLRNFADGLAETITKLPERFDRHAPTDLAFICNAETLMNIAHARLCRKAAAETRIVVLAICAEVQKVDPALFPHLVPKCIYRGGICREPKSCGYCKTELGQKTLTMYKSL